MRLKKKNIFIIGLPVTVILAVAIWGGTKIIDSKLYTLEKTTFESIISAKGEIQGKNSVSIDLPESFRNRELYIYDIKIKALVAEGTVVKKGDWIADMDVASIMEQIQRNNEDLERHRAELNDARIDTAIQLSRLREEIKEFNYDLDYKTLELEQAKFESPAYQRKTQVAYNKTIRMMDKKRRDYELRVIDLKRRINRTESYYMYYYRRDSLLKQAVLAARIVAPQNGLVMYAKSRNGRKMAVGDEVNPWNPKIASLPDMSVVISETYVEEIDITKIKTGNRVNITIDAMPENNFTGFVSEIANIGQELTGFDSKVFQVTIQLDQTIHDLKPAMTSNNNIVINSFPDVLTIPRQCLYSENGFDFVYLKKSGKIWKQKVKTGLENDKVIIIESGLNVDDKILYSPPEEGELIAFLNE